MGFAYVANIRSFLDNGGHKRCMQELGVQILTVDSISSRIFADSVLCDTITQALSEMIEELSCKQEESV